MSANDQYPEMCRVANLRMAWARVEESDGCAGIDGVSLGRFARDLEVELERLHRDLESGAYRPLPLVRFLVPKDDGGQRPLCVAAVRDRVAQHAAIRIVEPLFEAEFESCSYGYRRGRSVKQALQQVEALRESGYAWVVEADITAYFDNVDTGLLFGRVAEIVTDLRLREVIRLWVEARVYDGHRLFTLEKGLPQGSPISPLLANLYLDTFDEQMMASGRKLVRFADDFLVLCKSKPKAEQALRLTRRIMADLRLTLNDDKTRVTNFAEGFKYLGAVFTHSFCLPQRPKRNQSVGRATVDMPAPLSLLRLNGVADGGFNVSLRDALKEALQTPVDGIVPSCFARGRVKREEGMKEMETAPSVPPAAATATKLEAAANDSASEVGTPDALARDPTFPPPALFNLRTLYIHEHGAVLRCEQERLQIVKDETELLSLPLCKIDQIVLFGNSQVTTNVMRVCLRKGIPILLLTGQGRFLGAIEGANNQNVLLQQRQFERAADSRFVLEVARCIVKGKIGNCRALLQRRQRATADERLAVAIRRIGEMGDSLGKAETLDEVRGYEGAAGAAYFAGLAACFQAPFTFEGRNRRPPLDPVNALLSFGYTLLLQNIYALVRGRGLSPYVGTLHGLRQGHPALCSDLIEELRAPIVDSLVTTVLNKRIFATTDFYFVEGTDDADEGESEEAETATRRRGCRMTDGARRTFIEQFEQRMSRTVRHPRAGINTTWRGCIDLQIGHYIRVLRGETVSYVPLEIR